MCISVHVQGYVTQRVLLIIPPDLTLLGRKLKIIEEEGKEMYFEGRICSYDGQSGQHIVLSSLLMVTTTLFILPDDEDVYNSTV